MKSRPKAARRLPSDERVGYRLAVIAKRLEQTLADMHAKTLGISIGNWKIMRVVGLFGPLSATEVGNRTGLDPDKITRAVDALVQRGYVIRKDDEADRRRVVLTLSAKGRRVHDKIDGVAGAMEAEFLSVLTAEESKILRSALTKLEEHSDGRFGRHEGWYQRRQVPGTASRAVKPSGVRIGSRTASSRASTRSRDAGR